MFGKSKWKTLREALQTDDPKQVKLRYFGTDRCYDACNQAIQQGASKVLQALAETQASNVIGKFVFASDWEGSKSKARALIAAAASSPNPTPLLLALYNANKVAHQYGKLSNQDFMNKDMPVEFIKAFLPENPALFDYCVKNVGLASTDNKKLAAILDFGSIATNPQPTLDNALVRVAKEGDAGKAEVLLAHNANPNFDNGTALLRAGENGNQAMVDLLLPHMKPALCGDVVLRFERSEFNVPQAIVSCVEAAAQKTTPAQQPRKEVASTADYDKRVGDDTLAEVRALPDGSTLTTLFNFASEQQLIISDRFGVTTPPVSFNQIDKAIITAKRKKFDELGEEKSTPSPRQHIYPTIP